MIALGLLLSSAGLMLCIKGTGRHLEQQHTTTNTFQKRSDL